MRAIDIISKKRDNKVLTGEEIDFLIKGYISAHIPDYQMSAFLMAVYFNGLDFEETFNLTMAMLYSGNTVDLSQIKGIKVDKHSTGGVGDKTTIVVAPLVAAAGVPVPKMSGHGLGHTGGTLDKLTAIPGFKTELSMDDFLKTVERIGVAVTSQSESLVPADKKIYELRDVTATVEHISLIASSIMSKKLAVGSDAVLLDVKTGSGAFMKTLDDSIRLAKMMVNIGNRFGKKTKAYITDMSQPIGNTVGNAIEIEEAIQTLKGEGPKDFTELCIELSGEMLVLGGKSGNVQQGKEIVRKVLKTGLALEKMEQWIDSQGGNPRIIQDLSLLPKARYRYEVLSKKEGYICAIDAELIGLCAMRLGAGRERKGQNIDLSAGIRLFKKVGEPCFYGEPIAVLYSFSSVIINEIGNDVVNAFKYTHDLPAAAPIIHAVIDKS